MDREGVTFRTSQSMKQKTHRESKTNDKDVQSARVYEIPGKYM